MKKIFSAILGIACAQFTYAALPSISEVVTLPSEAAYGGGDVVGSPLVAATYNGGKGPGIWIVADGGYRLYHNGNLLAEDNQSGRVRFIPMTFLPGENAISVVGVNGEGAPGVMVQIDELNTSYYSGAGWYSKPSVGNNSWKNKGRDLSQWGGATTLSYSNQSLPSGESLNGWPEGSAAKWIWTSSESDKYAVLLYTLNIKAEGFGASTTGGEGGNVVVATDMASIKSHLQSSEAVTILVPEGTYDFRTFKDAATNATAAGRTWCSSSCSSNDKNSSNTFYRISFQVNSCSDLGSDLNIVTPGTVNKWDTWITVKNNKSLIGMGRGANLRGAALANRSNEGADNNIYRNLAIYDVNPHLVEGNDGLSVVGNSSDYVTNFWADHISYKWISDGMDLEFLKGATISYLHYDGANEYNCYYYDPYMHLVQNSEITMANIYWQNTYGRVPKLNNKSGDPSKLHIYNSYIDYNYWHLIDVNGNGYPAYLLYENAYIDYANSQIAGKNDETAYIKMSNVTVQSAKSSKPYSNIGTAQSSMFNDNVFTPSYTYTKRSVSTLRDSLPILAGVGGRFGSMPSYNQAFGLSNKAPSVSVSPVGGEESISLTASATDADGSVKSVEYFVGTTSVGSSTTSPYNVEVTGLSAGTYSVVAIATDNSGLTSMSAFENVEVSGSAVNTEPEIIKHGSGSSSQTMVLGDSIKPYYFNWTNAETISVEGVPAGIEVVIENESKKVSFRGTPTEVGVFPYTVQIVGTEVKFSATLTITGTELESSGSEGSSSSSPLALNYTRNSLKMVSTVKIFDMQGRLLYSGATRPQRLPAETAIVIELDNKGFILSKRVERNFR